jgi:predicted nucleotide-binding protein
LTKEGDEAANHPKGILGYLADNENKRKSVMTNRVFIVHGHNDAVKEKVARFVEHLKLTPIILHEQIDRGQTIIEKVESNSNDVNFAIVLLTADDEGKAKTETDYKLRARQNVIFEMGYFFGLLSRSHVFLLLDDDVEKPSDLSGIVYNSLKEDWKTKLFKELQACGYKVDPEDLLI